MLACAHSISRDESNMPKITYDDMIYDAREGESVLDVLLRGGADVGFSCRKGACHCCMLRVIDGAPTQTSTRGLAPSFVDSGHFLPCLCVPDADMTLDKPDLSKVSYQALVADVSLIGPDIARLQLEPATAIDWRPGQFINLTHDDASRSYSITSVAAHDYFLELHIKLLGGGAISPWVHHDLSPGELVTISNPNGDCSWRPELSDQPLLLVATGVGAGAMAGVARDALANGHTAPITLVIGATDMRALYLHDTCTALADAHDNLTYIGYVSREEPTDGALAGRVTDHLAGSILAPEATTLFLCGNPDMVFDARVHAVRAGINRRNIIADPYEPAAPFIPDESAKLDAIEPDLELWDALGRGAGLREILEDFYTHVYADERLAPFFHNATKQRAISKQYEFLADLLTGRRVFFGMKPFNAHHWMIISDDLFDYREELVETCARRWGLGEEHLRRWMALHEMFRREIVKPVERGIIIDGEELLKQGYSLERIEIATICDACFEEINVGDVARMHQRTGELFCMNCGGKKASSEDMPR